MTDDCEEIKRLKAALAAKFSVCPGPDAILVCEDKEAMYSLARSDIKGCHTHPIILRSEWDDRLVKAEAEVARLTAPPQDKKP